MLRHDGVSLAVGVNGVAHQAARSHNAGEYTGIYDGQADHARQLGRIIHPVGGTGSVGQAVAEANDGPIGWHAIDNRRGGRDEMIDRRKRAEGDDSKNAFFHAAVTFKSAFFSNPLFWFGG